MMKFNDNYFSKYDDEEKLSLGLFQQETDSKWVDCEWKNIKILDVDVDKTSITDLKDKYDIDASEDAIADAISETGIILTISGKGHLLSQQAKSDLVCKLGANCSSFSKLSFKDQVSFLNKCRSLFLDKQIKIVSFAEKIRAILSINYSKIENMAAFETVTTYLDEKFPNSVFENGDLSHDIVSAEWILHDKKLSSEYSKKVADAFSLIKEAEPAFEFVNSITGRSSLQLKAIIRTSDTRLSLGTSKKILHKGSTSIETFKTEVEEAYSSMYKSFERIEALKDIHMDYPESALITLCNRFHLSKKSLDRILPIYSAITASSSNALAVWYGLNQVLADMRNNSKMSSVALFNLEEQVTTVLNPSFKWNKIDEPIAVKPIAETE